MRTPCHALLAFSVITCVLATRRGAEVDSPVTRIVKLLTEMKAQVEAEADEDESIYEKMDCWCKTNDREKTAATKKAELHISELEASIEGGEAHGTRLFSEIEDIKADMQASQESIDTAAALREKEKAEYEEEAKDLAESIKMLREAVAVLAKVQLMQGPKSEKAAAAALVQVKDLVSLASSKTTSVLRSAGVYKSVMQKDLWDLLSTMPVMGASVSGDGHVVTGLQQQPMGAVSGATSYGARSSSVYGMLKQMQETFEKDLATSQRTELEAEISFQHLRSSKEGELRASGSSAEMKSAELANVNNQVAQAKADVEDTKAALSADQKFLIDLKERCTAAASSYAERKQTRRDEIQAIAEAIQILTEDDARDLFSKTISFLQTRHQKNAGREQQRRTRAAARLLAVAKRRGGPRLATLAVGVQLDGFEKVKEIMDNMVAELKTQQKEEYSKHETCQKDIDNNEDDTREMNTQKKDLTTQITGLEGHVQGLTEELKELSESVAKAHVAMKSASEQRKAENHEFQQVVADQRATVSILQKALARLQAFYVSHPGTSALLSIERHSHRQEPGAAAPPPPPAGKAYSKSGGGAGILQMLAKIIQDAERADQEAVLAEQASQDAYTELVTNINAELDAMAEAISEKTIAKEKGEADKLSATSSLQSTEADIENLGQQSKALHLKCDYLVKYFSVRQRARQEEIEAIQEAKAILSGADFGSEE